MQKIKRNFTGIVLCVFEMIIGILLLINPVGFTSAIIAGLGMLMILFGVLNIIKYFRTDALRAAAGQTLAFGLFAILAGALCPFKTQWFIATFPVLTILYGIFVMLAGLMKVQLTVDLIRFKNKRWIWAGVAAAISIVCAVVILSRPFTSTAVLWMFTGASLIVESITDMVAVFVTDKARIEQE